LPYDGIKRGIKHGMKRFEIRRPAPIIKIWGG